VITIRRKLLMTLILASSSLAACSANLNDVNSSGCPPLKNYSAEEQKAAAAEIRKNPNGPLSKFARDYGLLRKACRITE
jgi:hypothetical protein